MPNFPTIGNETKYIRHGNNGPNVFTEAKLGYDNQGLLQGYKDAPSEFFGYGGNDTFYADSGIPAHGFSEIDKHTDVFNGGGGSDTVSYHQSADGVVVDLDYNGLGAGIGHRQGQDAYNWTPYTKYERDELISIENVVGSDHNDIITGDAYANVLIGRGGDDFMRGGTNHDTIHGGLGEDTIKGDAHNDVLHGNGGNDQIYGGSGHDTAYGGSHNDTLRGGSGNDQMHGDGGNDRIYGQSGHDKAWGGAGNDTLYMGSGDDTAYGGGGDDFISLGSGENVAYGGYGFNTIYGGANDDVVSIGEQGVAKTYNGDDYVVGGGLNDTLEAGSGDDTVFGGGGNDHIAPGAGDDDIYGGGGTDSVIYDGLSSNVFVSLAGGFASSAAGVDALSSIENVVGSAHGDAIYGNNGANTLLGENGDDQMDGLGGLDVIYGGNGDDTIEGGGGRDFLFGQDDDDDLFGEGGNDFLKGGEGHDKLDGGSGRDNMNGEDGNDLLNGGSGADMLTGGEGADTFVFNDIFGAVDTVTDFTIGVDRLDLDGVLAAPPPEGGSYVGQVLAFSANGGDDTQLWAKSGHNFRKVAVLEDVGYADVAAAVASGELFDINPTVTFDTPGSLDVA